MPKKDKKYLDSDADGLTDLEEEKLGTNPYDKDTDHDQLNDYEEVNIYGTDPLNPDTDSDGVLDGQEVKMGQNPRGKGTLKDLFIPHQGNNYRPHSLHPKRLVFHAVSAVAIKAIMVGFLVAFPIQAWLSPDVLYEKGRQIITLTNNLRASLGINPLVENQKLNQAALNKAQDMLVQEYFAHVGPDGNSLRNWLFGVDYAFKVAGENLAIGFSEPTDVMLAWQDSPTHYANLIDPDYKEIGVGVIAGNYQTYDTTLIAQYFANPIDEESILVPQEPIEDSQPEPVVEEKPATEPQTDPQNNKIEEQVIEPDSQPEAPVEPIEEPQEPIEEPKEVNTVEEPIEPEEDVDIVEEVPDVYQPEYVLIVDNDLPEIDHSRTQIFINKPAVGKDIVVRAVAYLGTDTREAEVVFGGKRIVLFQNSVEDNKWTGSQIVSEDDYKELTNPTVLASIRVVDNSGNTLIQDINWQDITPVKSSVIEQYSYAKDNPGKFIEPIFDVGSIYFQALLILSLLALFLNIFINIRKQHPKTVFSAIGFIALISLLTIL